MKRWVKKNPWIIMLIIVMMIAVFLVLPFHLSGKPLSTNDDIQHQYYLFFEHFRNLIKVNRTIPFYSWELFLGTNFWASKSYYLLGDIYNYPFIFTKLNYFFILEIQTIMKLMVSSLTFYFYMKSFQYKEKVCLFLGIVYAFSAWSLYSMIHPMYMSFLSIIPLYFLGVESYLKYKKKCLFIISTMLLLLINYYLFFTLSLLTTVYYLYRYYQINRGFNKEIGKSIVTLIGYYIIGTLITMPLILPSFLFILENNRVGSVDYSLLFKELWVYLNIILAPIFPLHSVIYKEYNLLRVNSYQLNELFIWASSATILLGLQWIQDKDKIYRKSNLAIFILFFWLLIVPFCGSVLHGFGNTSFRWVFFIVIILLMNVGRYLNDLSLVNITLLKKTFCGIVVIYAIMILMIVSRYQWTLISSQYLPFYGITAIILICFGFMYQTIKKQQINRIMVVALLEIIVMTFVFGSAVASTATAEVVFQKQKRVLEDNYGDFNNYLLNLNEANKHQFYRVFADYESIYWYLSLNSNLLYGVKGISTYDSTYQNSVDDLRLISDIGYPEAAFDWQLYLSDPNLIDFFSIRYAVVSDEAQLPHQNFELITNEYRGWISIYENKNYRSVGNTYTQVMSYDEFTERGLNTQDMLDWIIAHPKDIDDIKIYLESMNSESLVGIRTDSRHLVGEVSTDEKSFLIVAVPYDEGWSATINGNSVPIYKVNGGMMGIPVEAGVNNLILTFLPKGFKAGIVLSLIGILSFIGILVWDKRKKNIENSN